MVGLKAFPIIYPPDGLYYIYSKDFGHFWKLRGREEEGGQIDCDVLSQDKGPNSMDHRIWKVTTINAGNSKAPRPRITLQNLQTIQRSVDDGGYVAKKTGKIVQTKRKTAWNLVGDATKPFAYKIVTDDRRISINAPSPARLDTLLLAEPHIRFAYDASVYDPQWWYFIPVDQIEQFTVFNGIKRSAT